MIVLVDDKLILVEILSVIVDPLPLSDGPKSKSLFRTLWEKRNQHFLHFPQCFLPSERQI